jgi:hypothetical protein
MVIREFQDGGRIKKKIPERSVGSLKGDLSIDTTFDSLKSRWTVPLLKLILKYESIVLYNAHMYMFKTLKTNCPLLFS